MRSARILSFLAIVGCSSPSPASPAAPPSSASPPSSAPPSSVAAPAPTATTTPSDHAESAVRPPTAAEMRARLARLREARAAAGAHDYPRALATFDAMLHETPRTPRLLCEAGYVAHLAGNERLAASRIDLALSIFGPDAQLAADARSPVAMCLFNRGLVAEALGDAEAARDAYRRSVALRPNASVQRHLDALAPDDDDDDAAASIVVGGVRVTDGERAVRLATGETAAIERVLANGLSGEDWDGLPVAATVQTVARAPATGAFEEVLLTTIDDGSAMLANTSLAVALRGHDATWIAWASIGCYDSTDHGHSGGCDASGYELTVAGDLVLVTYDVACGESSEGEAPAPSDHPDATCYATESEESSSATEAIVCRLEADPHCVLVHLSSEITERPWTRIYCEDEDGNEITVPQPASDPRPLPAPTLASATLVEGRVRVSEETEGVETHHDLSFAELVDDEPFVLPSLLEDAEREEALRASEEGDEGAEDGSE